MTDFESGLQHIRLIAKSYIGQKEIPPNRGFVNTDFAAKMKTVGFYSGAPWCGFFCKLVWKEAGVSKSTRALISASSRLTINNGTGVKNWHTEPIVGAVACFATFKNGKRQTTGHLAVVTEVKSAEYTTIDGNTTDKGGREGIMVAVRNRHLTSASWEVDNGLRLMGFIYPTFD